MEVANQIAVISGGGSGMGAETARYLSKKGAKVAILDLNEDKAKRVATEIQGLGIACDVTSPEQTESALLLIQKKLGDPRICVNCAGIAPAKRIVGRDGPMPLDEFTQVIQVNLIGTFNLIRLVATLMTKLDPIGEDNERGVIINTASIAAFEGQIGQVAYSASKGGVCAITLPAARELAQFHIRVMTIAPGLIQTPLLESLPENVRENLVAAIPFPKRFGLTSEYAKLVLHIIGNPLLNGEVIRLDGALRMQSK